MDFAGQAPVSPPQVGGGDRPHCHRPVLEDAPHVWNAYKQCRVHLRRPRPPLTTLTHGSDLYLLQLSGEERL